MWGNNAKVFGQKIEKCLNSKDLIHYAPHPSPLSAYQGFFNSKPFSWTNQKLKELGKTEIKWWLERFKMITKFVNKLENKLTPLLLSFLPPALLIIYLISNNMLNEDNLLVISLAFIINFMTALIVLLNAIHSMKYWTSSNNIKYFVQFVLWTIATLVVEYFITVPKIKWAIILANGIVFLYIFELINQYFKQNERKQD